jgi:hypothetical protein
MVAETMSYSKAAQTVLTGSCWRRSPGAPEPAPALCRPEPRRPRHGDVVAGPYDARQSGVDYPLRRVLQIGVDGVITDRPDRVLDFLNDKHWETSDDCH